MEKEIQKPIVDRVRDIILDHDEPTEAFLSEEILARKLKCSRTPIRESLIQLDREGLVEIHPKRGTQVRKIGIDEITENIVLRLALIKRVVEELVRRKKSQRVEPSADADIP